MVKDYEINNKLRASCVQLENNAKNYLLWHFFLKLC